MIKNLKIRKGKKKDITSLYKLIKELARYEKSEHKLKRLLQKKFPK